MKYLTAMLGRAADGAVILDQDGTVVYWNRAAERLLGFRAEEVIGRPCHDVMCGGTLGGLPLCSASCPIGRRITRGQPVRNFDMQAHTKAGRPIWLNVSSLPIPSQQGKRFHALHLFRDITKQAKVHQLVNELCVAVGHVPPRGQREQSRAAPSIAPDLPLSGREREVLRLLASGHTTKAIADSLCISPATVRNHVQHILEKLGAHSRLQALAMTFPPGSSR
jgi:PAS domain S-box-containing protein